MNVKLFANMAIVGTCYAYDMIEISIAEKMVNLVYDIPAFTARSKLHFEIMTNWKKSIPHLNNSEIIGIWLDQKNQ